MNIENPPSLTIDGVEYPLSGFSETVQRLVSIHTKWRNDLQEERLQVAKTEAAIRALDVELTQTVTAEIAADTAEVNSLVRKKKTPGKPPGKPVKKAAKKAPK